MKHKDMKKVMISIIIGFFALNLGIGTAYSEKKQEEAKEWGNPENQLMQMITVSDYVQLKEEQMDDIKEVVNGRGTMLVRHSGLKLDIDEEERNPEILFIGEGYKFTPEIKEGRYLSKDDIKSGGKVVIGDKYLEEIYKDKRKPTVGENINIEGEEYELVGIANSRYKSNRVDKFIFLSLNDFKDVYSQEEQVNKHSDPFNIELRIEGENLESIQTDLDGLIKSKIDVDSNYYMGISGGLLKDRVELTLKPSTYVLSVFGCFIIVFSILNLWGITTLILEKSYKEFAILKSLGKSENMIAIDFIKGVSVKVVLAAIIGLLIYLILGPIIMKTCNVYIYSSTLNIVVTLMVSIITCLVAFINPYKKIKKINLIEYLKQL